MFLSDPLTHQCHGSHQDEWETLDDSHSGSMLKASEQGILESVMSTGSAIMNDKTNGRGNPFRDWQASDQGSPPPVYGMWTIVY